MMGSCARADTEIRVRQSAYRGTGGSPGEPACSFPIRHPRDDRARNEANAPETAALSGADERRETPMSQVKNPGAQLEICVAEAASLRRKLRLPAIGVEQRGRGAAYPTSERQAYRRNRLGVLEDRLIPGCASAVDHEGELLPF